MALNILSVPVVDAASLVTALVSVVIRFHVPVAVPVLPVRQVPRWLAVGAAPVSVAKTISANPHVSLLALVAGFAMGNHGIVSSTC